MKSLQQPHEGFMTMKTARLFSLFLIILAGGAHAATAVKVDFPLKTTDAQGAPLTQNRYFYLYRPDNLPRTTPLPMVLLMEDNPDKGVNGVLNAKANKMGFVVVTCAFSGNSTGTPGRGWINGDLPAGRITTTSPR